MNTAPRGERMRIAILGRCNTGKSTILNLLTGEETALVSEQPGTTADPVAKAFELLPLGPVTFYDTAGLDESSALGDLRRAASRKVLSGADMALLVTDENGLGIVEKDLIASLRALQTPFLLIFNKRDEASVSLEDANFCEKEGIVRLSLSALNNPDPAPLREAIIAAAPKETPRPLLADLVPEGGTVICVTPIDDSAPKGRLIIPQVQVLRELVELNRLALVTQETGLSRALAGLNKPPDLVVTDSQVVEKVAEVVPESVPMTTFSLLFSRLKGDFALQLAGAGAINRLDASSVVLVAEACLHHPQGDDIGRVKLPRLLRKHTGRDLEFVFCSGQDFPDDLTRYALVLHCGGCMLNVREMRRRLKLCAACGVPVTNYGMAISLTQGVLERAAAPLVKAASLRAESGLA